MGKDVYDHSEIAKAYFDQSNQVLGESLSDLIFHGEEAVLKQTSNTQPALLTASIAYWSELAKAGVKADYMAGHSLGEYSALVASGILSFADAVALVRKRGLLMEQAVPNGQGTMAAILGADREALKGDIDLVLEFRDRILALCDPLPNVKSPAAQGIIAIATAGLKGVAKMITESIR
jgi:[acyl-carrier-protein] S-malonyltransferase